MDITDKLKHLNCELQSKGKIVADMISSVNKFKAKQTCFVLSLRKGFVTLINLRHVYSLKILSCKWTQHALLSN